MMVLELWRRSRRRSRGAYQGRDGPAWMLRLFERVDRALLRGPLARCRLTVGSYSNLHTVRSTVPRSLTT